MEKDQLDVLLEKVLKNEYHRIKGINDTQIPSFQESMEVFRLNLNRTEYGGEAYSNHHHSWNKPRRFITLKRGIAIACAILAISVISPLALDSAPVDALRNSFREFTVKVVGDRTYISRHMNRAPSSDSSTLPPPPPSDDGVHAPQIVTLEEAKKGAPYHLYIPGWLPEGYTLDKVEWTNTGSRYCSVSQYYRKGNEGMFTLIQYNDENAITSEAARLSRGGVTFSIVEDRSNTYYFTANLPTSSACSWYNENLGFKLLGSFSKDIALEIIKGLK